MTPAEHAALMQTAYRARDELARLASDIAFSCVGASDYAQCSAVATALRNYLDGIGRDQLARAEDGDTDGLVRFLNTATTLLANVGDERHRAQRDQAANRLQLLADNLQAVGVVGGGLVLVLLAALALLWLLRR